MREGESNPFLRELKDGLLRGACHPAALRDDRVACNDAERRLARNDGARRIASLAMTGTFEDCISKFTVVPDKRSAIRDP